MILGRDAGLKLDPGPGVTRQGPHRMARATGRTNGRAMTTSARIKNAAVQSTSLISGFSILLTPLPLLCLPAHPIFHRERSGYLPATLRVSSSDPQTALPRPNLY